MGACRYIMPPKAAAKAGKAGTADAAMGEKQEQLATIHRQCEAYENMIAICHEQTKRASLESLNLKKKIAELNEKFEEEEKLTRRTCEEMFGFYRNGQTALLQKIESQQNTIATLRQELDEARSKLERTKSEKDAVIAEKTKKINEQKQKMEEMAIAFGIKLKETLEQMSRYIQGDMRREEEKPPSP